MVSLQRPICDLVAEVKAGKLSAVQLVQASLDAMEASNDYNAVLEVSRVALDQAKKIDTQLGAGKNPGRLAGIPFIAKDNFLTHHTHTTAASTMLENFTAPYQSTAIELLEAEGAIMVGKANHDAFAHGASTENSDFGPTKNPVDPTRVPGGSSGGSTAAVALGLACFALGTDTAGSIRQPAAFSGVVGLKPTYGLVSRYGVIAMGSSLDVIGPITNRVEDAALVLDVMAGKDIHDATTIEREDGGYVQTQPFSLKGKKIGLVKEYMAEGTAPEVLTAIRDAAQKLTEAGATVEDVSLPSGDLSLAIYYVLTPAEVSSNLARHDGIRYGYSSKKAQTLAETYQMSRDEGFGDEAKRRILIGTYVLSSGYYDAYYKQAQKVRTILIREFEKAFKNFDFLLSPTAPTTAFKIGEKDKDPLAMYLCDIYTVAADIVGAAAISIPAPVKGLPIGIQLIAPQRADRNLLGAAKSLEGLLT